MTGKVFINYRRGDDPGFVQALYLRLEEELGRDGLFMDVEGHIQGGDDFVDVLKAQVAQCDVLLAIIGPRWLTIADETGRQRLDNPADWVRVEIVGALEDGKRVIPVLVGGADVPRADDLPDPLKPLARKHAIRITLERFKADSQGLVGQIKAALAEVAARRHAETEAERAALAESERQRAAEEEARLAERARQEAERARQQAVAGLSTDQITRALEVENWAFIKAKTDPAEFRDHIARYAGGPTERFATERLAQLVWAGLARTDKAALQAFADEFPKAPQIDDVRGALLVIERREAAARASAVRKTAETAARAAVARSLEPVSSTSYDGGDAQRAIKTEERKVIIACSAGTIFVWYDFYLYGSLAGIIGAQFFSAYPEATRNVFALLAFAAGFIVRPFGALVFGRLGDMIGRKYTFLVTILIMGISTFLVGCLPNYETIGSAAPIILILLRMAQGLALGGEYGGAAIYVAEHAPQNQRGYFTSFIQTTATLGLLLSLVVIMFTQIYVNANFPAVGATYDGKPWLNVAGNPVMLSPFAAWGWRIPFVGSAFLLLIALYVRLQMHESPVFKKMKEEGKASTAPFAETFGQWENAKIAVIALLGLVAGQAVIWYTGQFYALFYLQSILKVDQFTANVLIAWSLILGTGGFIFFGSLSDKIGRKPIILGGCLLGALLYAPSFIVAPNPVNLFNLMSQQANPALSGAWEKVKVTVVADKDDCSFQFNPTGTVKFTNSCDILKAALARLSVNYSTVPGQAGNPASVKIGDTEIVAYDVAKLSGDAAKTVAAAFNKALGEALTKAGYPAASNPSVVKIAIEPKDGLSNFAKLFDIFTAQRLIIIGILTVMVLLVTMVYGPIAAALVELFPTRIRYTGLSLPYHVGNGWFGGLMPATSFAMVTQTGDVSFGLWYPVVIALMTVVIGFLFVPETHKRDILKN